VSDRLKSCVPNGPLNYVLSLEGNDWFAPGKVAMLADIYMNNYSSLVVHPSVAGNTTHTVQNTRGGSTNGKRCYRCQSFTHLARFCPRGRGTGNYTCGPQVNFYSRGRGADTHRSIG